MKFLYKPGSLNKQTYYLTLKKLKGVLISAELAGKIKYKDNCHSKSFLLQIKRNAREVGKMREEIEENSGIELKLYDCVA